MKKITIYKIILVLLIIAALVLATFIIKKYIDNKKVENQLQEILQTINTQSSEDELDIVQEIDAQIEGYKVIGIIKIPKINIEYPILEKTDKTSLKLSITKFWGNQINQIGNVVLAGHNNLNNKFFGKIDKLQEGDIIELTDKQRVTIKYEIFKTYVVDPNDISPILTQKENAREVTLITCTNGNKERLVVKAREINNEL